MPNHKSAEKRLKTAEKARVKNKAARTSIRTSLKKIRTAETKEVAAAEMPRLFSLLDRAAARNRAGMTKNSAANYKRKAHLALSTKSA